MDKTKEYETYLLKIDKMKKSGMKLGMTKICKEEIDKCYMQIANNTEIFEVALYKRKALLTDEISANTSVGYSINNLIVGAIAGSVMSTCTSIITQILGDLVFYFTHSIKYNPKDILSITLNEDNIILIIAIIVLTVQILFFMKFFKFRGNEQDSFCKSMCEYENTKIDELLKCL